MVTPELKWPTTNLTPSPTNLLATETPCFGSDDVVALLERDLLAEDAAGLVDVVDGLLGAVAPAARRTRRSAPVIGPATPILIWALAAPENARAATSATPDNQCFDIHLLLWVVGALGPPLRTPAERNSTLAADTISFSRASHLKKRQAQAAASTGAFSRCPSDASSSPRVRRPTNIASPSGSRAWTDSRKRRPPIIQT